MKGGAFSSISANISSDTSTVSKSSTPRSFTPMKSSTSLSLGE
eukprot:CAMPEP_0116014416 /NCGR_PEP_ID=MMETSP0321-20121206/6262_1 /TAXON_ID=163516 /ORGANISM="Leptocylindrus danicus var. danicus, Strain B650" /LENGTH=42 /DNA_ID= /DNA_START= /DNA_END= /DNA_ORIENTATION=